jgi:hypothetical protein
MEEEELSAAKKVVQKLWEDEYSGLLVDQEVPILLNHLRYAFYPTLLQN